VDSSYCEGCITLAIFQTVIEYNNISHYVNWALNLKIRSAVTLHKCACMPEKNYVLMYQDVKNIVLLLLMIYFVTFSAIINSLWNISYYEVASECLKIITGLVEIL
jgi:hypothetical protein